jgi:murein DD-endopeptidase MepM/ murein hydrolase activator NlpD
MCALRWSALWPRVVAISLIGFGAASCTDSGRFSDTFGPDPGTQHITTGSIPQRPAPSSAVISRPLPPIASADPGYSGGGRGMGSYQPGNGEITGSVAPAPPPPPQWTWEGGTPIIVGPGETLEMISRKHHVPMSAIMQANNITSPSAVHPGQHLVIPRLRSAPAAYAPPPNRVASVPSAPPPALRPAMAATSGVHVVAPGETLNSIARLYGKTVAELARANNIPPDTMVRVGQRIVVPDVRPERRAEARPEQHAEARAPATAPAPARPEVAEQQSPHSAWKASPVEPSAQQSPVKAAEAVGSLPSFRWPVRGRVIAAFGPSPNGLQNDGIDLAVPQGTPVKAADDGVVAYAGNELKGYGNLVLIRHSNGYVTAYAHASEILVKRGETVKRGEVIAKSGETGNVKAPELHFEIRKGATPVDPAQFLNGA